MMNCICCYANCNQVTSEQLLIITPTHSLLLFLLMHFCLCDTFFISHDRSQEMLAKVFVLLKTGLFGVKNDAWLQTSEFKCVTETSGLHHCLMSF